MNRLFLLPNLFVQQTTHEITLLFMASTGFTVIAPYNVATTHHSTSILTAPPPYPTLSLVSSETT